MMPCTTHHHACDCREAKLRTLVIAALNGASTLDWIKNTPGIQPHMHDEAVAHVEAIYRAAEAIGVVIGSPNETPDIKRMTQYQEAA
jgi:hypothetical protein